MLRFRSVLLLTIVFLLIANASFARSWYLGIRGGLMMADSGDLGDALNVGLLLGTEIRDLKKGSLAVEGELTTTASKGDVSVPNNFDGKWELNTASVWLGYRSVEFHSLYLKGKVGVEYVDFSISRSGNDFSDSDLGGALGIGGGWQISESYSLELEYSTKVNVDLAGRDRDINFLSLGLNCHF